MNSLHVGLRALAVVAVGLAPSTGVGQDRGEAEIRNLQARQADAWNRHDATAYARLFTENGDVVNVVGWWWKGRSEIESKLTAAFAFVFRESRMSITEVQVRFVSPEIALAHVRWTMVGAKAPPGIPEPREGIQLQVLKKEAGKWLIDSFQNTSSVPERPFPTGPVNPPASMQPAIADSLLRNGGAQLHYRIVGRGPPIVLVHGFAGSADDLSVLRSALAPSRMVIAVEIRGFGRSTGALSPRGADTAIVEDIARVMDHLRVTRADFVGFSMGAILSTRFALLHPERVRTLVLLSAAPMLKRSVHALMDSVADDLEQGRGLSRVIRAVNPIGTPMPSDSLITVWSREAIGQADTLAWAAVARGLGDLSFTPAELSSLAPPVMTMYGNDDPLKAYQSEWLPLIRFARAGTIAGVNHATLITNPTLIGLVGSFLESRGTGKR